MKCTKVGGTGSEEAGPLIIISVIHSAFCTSGNCKAARLDILSQLLDDCMILTFAFK